MVGDPGPEQGDQQSLVTIPVVKGQGVLELAVIFKLIHHQFIIAGSN